MKNKKFWQLKNVVEGSDSGAKLYIDGVISDETWWGDEATPQQLRQELKGIVGNTLEVVINSPGGDVWAGVAMYDALKELDKEVTIKVSGLAASIASVIAMAGDKIVITPGSTMMIHKASMFAWGNSEDMQKAIEMLETVEDGIVSIYADRTGQTREQVEAMMKAETWMSAEKAVELKFADAVVKPEASTDEEPEPANLFGGNFAFSMQATKNAMQSFIEKATAEPTNEAPEAEGDATNDSEEPEPTTPADEADATQTETAEVTDTQPEVTITNSVDKETTMPKPNDAAADVAADQVITPQNQAPVETAPTVKIKDYLKSDKAVEDFAEVLRANAGGEAKDVRNAWVDHIKTVQNNVTNPEVLLPEAVVQSIRDAFEEGGEIWNLVNKTGLDVFKVAWDTVTGENSRAKGHTRGDEKGEEVITLDDRTLRPQFIYKYLTLDKETVRENRSTGALLRYVLSELPKRIIREVERAIVIGDGRASDSDYKIKEGDPNGFYPVKADTDADNSFGTTYVPQVDEGHYESMLRARALVKAAGAKHLVAKTGFLVDALLEQNVNGAYIFAPGTDVARALGFAGAIEPDWMEDDTDNDAYIVVFAEYRTVGDNSIESFTNFILKENKNEYLQEIYAGGGLTALKAAVAIQSSDES